MNKLSMILILASLSLALLAPAAFDGPKLMSAEPAQKCTAAVGQVFNPLNFVGCGELHTTPLTASSFGIRQEFENDILLIVVDDGTVTHVIE